MSDPENIPILSFPEMIFNNSHDAFIISDRNKIIQYANSTAYRMFGYSADEIKGKCILELMPEGRKENYSKDITEAESGKVVSNIDSGEEFFGLRKSGDIFPIELTYTFAKFSGQDFFVSQIRDVTDGKLRTKELDRITSALKIITEINRILPFSSDGTEYLNKICSIINLEGFPKIVIHTLDINEKNQKVLKVAACNKSGMPYVDQSEVFVLSEIEKWGSLTVEAIFEKKTKYLNNIVEKNLWKYWSDDPGKLSFQSTIAVPIITHGEVLGVLRVFSKDTEYFDKSNISLLEQLAKDIAHGIDHLRTVNAHKDSLASLEIKAKSLRIISEINRLLLIESNEENYIRSACSIIKTTGDFIMSQILLIDEKDPDVLWPAAQSGYENNQVKIDKYSLKELSRKSPTSLSIKNKRTHVCRDIVEKEFWKYWTDSPEKMIFHSTVALPLMIDQEVIGVVRAFSELPDAFNENEIELLEELVRDTSHGIHYFRTKRLHDDVVSKLIEAENKYRSLFSSSNDAIIITDAETGIISDANKKAEDILKTSLDKIIGTNYLELQPEGYKEKYKNTVQLLSEKDISVSGEFYLRSESSSGKAIPVKMIADHIFINGKKYIQTIFRDISKEKKEEENIRNIQKMEALGTLSGGIAHDINNILSPIIGFAQIAILENEDKNRQNECINEILKAAERAKELIARILTFSRNGDTEKKPCRIQNIVREVLRLISSSIPDNIKLENEIDQNCGHILCDPIQIYQIIINLCTNAIYAMKDQGGILRICLVSKGSKDIKIELDDIIPFDDYICLIVSDTGTGMSKTILSRIYEPYFTTKPKGEGTGLGLSVVSGIVKDHGGDIYVRTYPDEGTYFRICFPIVESLSENIKNPKSRIKQRSENRKVLVVDDETQITFMLKYMLEELGLSSEIFNCPATALEAFRSDPDKYCLVITDQNMPQITGSELSIKILEIKPDIPIILNTGYSPVVSKKEALKMGIKEFMMKPITISDLSIIIERAMKNNNI